MRVDQALQQVRAIQWQLARGESRVCLRSIATAVSGFMAIGAATAQPHWIPVPAEAPLAFVAMWVALAAFSLVAAGVEFDLRRRWIDTEFVCRQTAIALAQFAPCVAVGGALTAGIAVFGLEHAALLPSLWAALFSLGLFSARRHLPPAAVAVSVYYLAMALVILWCGQSGSMLEPWTMGATFGIGQLLLAAALHVRREPSDETC